MTGADFIKAIIADPDADSPRIVYADWLEQNGEADWAELVRVQCELATILERECTCPRPMNLAARPPQDCPRCLRWAVFRQRERDLDWVTAYTPAVFGDPEVVASAWKFHRGFACDVSLPWDDWVEYADRLLTRCPIRNARDGVVRLTIGPTFGDLYTISRRHDIDWRQTPLESTWRRILSAEWHGVRFELSR